MKYMAESAVKVSVTVTMEMTQKQRDAYAQHFGAGFVEMEILNRLRPEMEVALRNGTPWLRRMQEMGILLAISKPVAETTDEPEGAAT